MTQQPGVSRASLASEVFASSLDSLSASCRAEATRRLVSFAVASTLNSRRETLDFQAPDLFPWGSVCHGATEDDDYQQLTELVREEVEELQRDGKHLPEAATRPMREAVLA